MSKELTNKHDEISRQFLSNVEVARDFLSQYLPKDILQTCNLSMINIESGSYIEHNLKKSYSDVVYRIDLYPRHGQLSRCVYIYTLVEHQSNAQEIMPLRIASYCLSILQKHIIKKEIPFYEGKIMSYAEELLKQGRQEGMSYAAELEKRGEQRGEQKAEKEIAQKLLKSGVDSSLIADATHLTKAQIDELKKSL